MAHGERDVAVTSAWAGGVRPFAMGSKKLGMWLFIISDSLTFSVLLLSYSYLRLANADWPRPFPFSPSIVFSTIMTVVLLFSSLTMVMAVAAAARGRRGTAVKWILGTMAGGAAFIGLHLTEWMHLIVATGFGLGKFKPEDVEVSGLYWHFVDLVWMFVFPLVYLMSVHYK